jgi:hypothetical protein
MPLVDKIDFLQMQMPDGKLGPKKFAPKSLAILVVYYGEVSWRAFQIGLLWLTSPHANQSVKTASKVLTN